MRYFIIAGEASGDLHAGNLIAELRANDSDARFCFLGGDRMEAAAGCAPVVHYRDMAYMGVVNVLLNLHNIAKIRKAACRAAVDFNPDKVILVDYPGFNLNFAKFVRSQLPNVEVIYYISPKLWAWKSYRIRAIRRYVHRMFTIFPFETEYYAVRGYKVEYVGNPTVDSVGAFLKGFDREAFRLRQPSDSRPLVLLLPGSRRQEVVGCLPRMIEVARRMPQCRFVVAATGALPSELYESITGGVAEIVYDAAYPYLAIADFAVVNSGTATLETALFRVPQVVVYDMFAPRLMMILKRLFLKTRYVSLVNILTGREVVRELILSDFTTEKLNEELLRLTNDSDYVDMIKTGYSKLAELLGGEGAASRCAKKIVNF